MNSWFLSYVKMKSIRNGLKVSAIISKVFTEYLNIILNITLNVKYQYVIMQCAVVYFS